MSVKASPAVLVVLAAVLYTMCLFAGPALANKTVSTSDGLSLTFTDVGAFSSLTVDGNTAPTLGVAGGFFIASMNGVSLPYTRDTFYAGTAITGTAVMEGGNVRITGTALQQSFNILLTGGLPYIKVDITTTGPTTDQAFLVYFRLPVDANGWTWQNDVNSKSTITNGSGNWYRSLGAINQARHPYFSDNPFGTITKTTSPTMGLSLSPLFYPPCAPTIQYNSQGGFWIEFEMGTTTKTTKNPQKAEAHCALYKHDPNWGQRSAIDRFYGFFPAWFTPQSGTRGGNWILDNSNRPTSPDTPADYGIVWQETSMWDDSYCTSNNIINCKYVEAWCEHCTWTTISACQTAANSGDNSWYDPGKGWGIAEAAQMIVLSGARNANGTYIGFDEQSYWTDDGSMFRAICNPDLEIPNFNNYNNPLPTHNRGTGAEYWEYYRQWGAAPGGTYSGFYHDSVGGWWAGFEVVHNFATEHWPYYDYSPGIYFGTVGGGPGIPTMWAPYSNVEFLKYTYEQMTAHNRPVMANSGPGPTLFMEAPWLDMIGAGEGYDGTLHGLSITRALAGMKPSSFLNGAISDAAMQNCLLMGIYPGCGTDSVYKSSKSLYTKYMPVLNQLDAAGWRPITAAKPSSASMLLERYGTGASNTIYLVLRATSTGSTNITVYNSDLGWPSSPTCTVTELLVGGSPSTSYDGSGNLVITCGSVSASTDRVYKIIRTGGGAAPVANFTGNPTIGAAPLAVAFTDTSTNSPTSWAWTFGDSGTATTQNPSHTYSSTGSFTVALTATNSYGNNTNTKNNYITVGNAPVANFSGTPTTGTAPLAVTFTDSSTNSPTSWAWTFGDSGTSTAQNPSHTYSSAGNYTVALTATNAYGNNTNTKNNYISVTGGGGSTPTFVAAGAVASNAAAITPALPAGIAINDILLLFLETANQAISISNQNGGTWAAVANSPQSVGTAGGSNGTRLTVFWSRYNGTQGAPTTSDSGNHQLGRIIAIRGAATSGNPWDVTAGGTESTVDTSGAIPGATTTVANTLVVAAIATSLPDASGTANFSAWTNANLTGLAERTDNTVTAGNGGGLALATGEKATAGAYTTTGVTCGTATTKAMMSIALKTTAGGSAPVANFSGTPTSGTAPLSVSFTDSSTNTPTSWSWAFGDASTSTAQNPTHSYAAGTYTVALTATNAYGNNTMTKTNYITASSGGSYVYKYPTAWASSQGKNCTLISGSLSDLQAQDSAYMVIQCDTSNQQYSVAYTSSTGYTPSQVTKITIDYVAKSSSSTSPMSWSVCWARNADGTWTNLGGWYPGTSDTSYTWNSTAVSTYVAADGTVGYRFCGCPTTGDPNYTISSNLMRFRLDLTGGGNPPVANFSGTPTTGAAPLAVSFTDSSTNTPTSWSWAFGDSSTSTAQNPSHSYAAGTYTVTLTATNAYGSDGETKTNYITAGNPPVANFSGTPTTGTAPLSVSFTDSSTNTPTSWSWSFGDSTTSTAQNPSHSYAAGTYTVTLTATNAYGSDGETKTNYITATSGTANVYPYNWTTWAGVTVASGSLTDVQTSNNTYMVFNCASDQKHQVEWQFDSIYTPSQVSNIHLDIEWHTSRTDTPGYFVLMYDYVQLAWISIGSWTRSTTDTTFTWDSTDKTRYMNSSGVLGMTTCGCPVNSYTYTTSFDMVRFVLTTQ